MLVRAPWQYLITLIVMMYAVYSLSAALAILFAILNWPYINSVILITMLAVYILAIPLNLNFTRRSYKVLIPWFIVHVLFSVIIYAWHYSKAGLQENVGQISHSFRDALYFSVTTWTTLGYGDFTAIPSMRLVTSIEALTSLFTIPIGCSLAWFMIQESTVIYTKAYLDKNAYDDKGHMRPEFHRSQEAPKKDVAEHKLAEN